VSQVSEKKGNCSDGDSGTAGSSIENRQEAESDESADERKPLDAFAARDYIASPLAHTGTPFVDHADVSSACVANFSFWSRRFFFFLK
jgi:hypothetical protein